MNAIRIVKKVFEKLTSFIEWVYVRMKYRKYLYPTTAPKHVRIDASTLCQLRCEGCGFQKSKHRGLGGGYLSAEDFRKFLDDNPQVERIELSNYGEIFLNPELIDIMKYAYEHNVTLEARMGANFNTVSDEQLNALVDYRFRFITLSIDGASQESYASYRRGGNFETVINNIRKLQKIKKEKNSDYPELLWQYIFTEYNEQDIPKAKELAKELGIPIFFKLNFMSSYKPADPEFIKRETGLDSVTRKEYLEKHKVSYSRDYCLQMISDPQINWDGKLLGCCMNENGFDANVFQEGLLKALCNPEYVKAKESLFMKCIALRRHSDSLCKKCHARSGILKIKDI